MAINFEKLALVFDRVQNPNKWMAKRYPKAAKNWRKRKKWLKRFGPDFNSRIKDMIYDENPLLARIPKGGY